MMFKYSCFISYRQNPEDKRHQLVVTKIYEEIKRILSYENKEVFLDRNSLKKGDNLEKVIPHSLCNSAFLVVIYTPNYFDKNNLWCAREYLAMLQLENDRLKKWGLQYDGSHQLIIPIICRYRDRLPLDIQDRLYYDLIQLTSGQQRFYQTNEFLKTMEDLANTILRRCDQFDNLEDSCTQCNEYKLPGDEETKKWIESSIDNAHQPFPGHTRN
jgi:hypothetical protein